MKKYILFIVICSILFTSFCGSLGVNARCSSAQLNKVCTACKNQALDSSQCMAIPDTGTNCPACPPTDCPATDSNCPVCVVCPSTIPTPNPNISPTPTPKPTGNVIFSDDFSGGFPGNKWVGSLKPQIDSSIGNPVPSLGIPSDSIRIQTAVNPFNSANGLSFSIDLRQPTFSSGSYKNAFTLDIINQNDTMIYARVVTDGTQKILYGTYPTGDLAGGDRREVETPYFPDNDFHNFKFVVDAQKNTKWYRDGVLQASNFGFPVGNYIVKLEGGLDNSPFPSYTHNVDNVLVTTP